MNTNIGLCCVFINVLRVVVTVSVSKKGRIIIEDDKRITALAYEEAFIHSILECAMICYFSERCTRANYREETRACYAYNQTCFLTEDGPGWKYLHQPQAERTFLYISNISLAWDRAKDYCKSIGGGLANVLTSTDHEMILNLPQQVWLGGSDIKKEGEWAWSNGCRFDDQDFNFWIPGQPTGLRMNTALD